MLAKDPAAVFEPGDHGSTFGGNPLMCAVAFAVVTYILENDVLGNVNRVGGVLKAGLERLASTHPLVKSARGDGLLLAVDLTVERATDVVRLGIEEGVLLERDQAPTRSACPRPDADPGRGRRSAGQIHPRPEPNRRPRRHQRGVR